MELDKNKLLAAYLRCGLTQMDFAKKARIAYPTLSKILRTGRCTMKTIDKLSKALCVAPESLLKKQVVKC